MDQAGDLLADILASGKRMVVATVSALPKALLALAMVYIGLKVINCVSGALQRRLEAISVRKRTRRAYRLPTLRSFASAGNNEDESDESDEPEPKDEAGEKSRVDPTLMKFVVSSASNGLKVMLLITVASMVGISTTSFIAVFSACTVAIGLALQGLLGDLAAGVMLLIFRRYDVGDLIEIPDVFGKVAEIGLFETTVRTLDNKIVVVPNSRVQVTTNLSEPGIIRVDVAVKIGHDTDLRAAKESLLQLVKTSPRVLPEPAPAVLLSEVDVLGKEFIMRVWVRGDDYIPVPFALREEAALALEEAGLALARWPVAEGAPAAGAPVAATSPLPTLLMGRAASVPPLSAGVTKAEGPAAGMGSDP
uniref:Mechanosensitive ion channel protein n=1 Tax=Zooxanthella nutricula TaxID=1333877 RepID=A0A7S2PC77_9DINO